MHSLHLRSTMQHSKQRSKKATEMVEMGDPPERSQKMRWLGSDKTGEVTEETGNMCSAIKKTEAERVSKRKEAENEREARETEKKRQKRQRKTK